MTWVSIVVLALLPFVSQTDAITACKSTLVNRVLKQTQLTNDAASYLSGGTVWVPLMISSDASGISSRKYVFGTLSNGALSATISSLSTAGVNTSVTATYTVSSSTAFSISESGVTYEAYAFKCSDNMMGFFRCTSGPNGYAQLFTVARIIDNSTEIAEEITACNKKMKNIDSYYSYVQLAHPYEV